MRRERPCQQSRAAVAVLVVDDDNVVNVVVGVVLVVDDDNVALVVDVD